MPSNETMTAADAERAVRMGTSFFARCAATYTAWKAIQAESARLRCAYSALESLHVQEMQRGVDLLIERDALRAENARLIRDLVRVS